MNKLNNIIKMNRPNFNLLNNKPLLKLVCYSIGITVIGYTSLKFTYNPKYIQPYKPKYNDPNNIEEYMTEIKNKTNDTTETMNIYSAVPTEHIQEINKSILSIETNITEINSIINNMNATLDKIEVLANTLK